MEPNQIKLSSVFSESFDFWKRFGGTVVAVSLIVYLPAQLIIELLSDIINRLFVIDNLNAIKLVSYIYEFIRYLLGSVASLGIIFFIYHKCKNEEFDYSVKDLLFYGLQKWPEYMYTGLVAFIKTLPYLLLLIIPGLIKGLKLSLVDCIVATRDSFGEQSCNESEVITNGRLGQIFGFNLVFGICSIFIELFFAFLILGGSGSTPRNILLAVTVKLIESYFVVTRAIYFFHIESFIIPFDLPAVPIESTSEYSCSSCGADVVLGQKKCSKCGELFDEN